MEPYTIFDWFFLWSQGCVNTLCHGSFKEGRSQTSARFVRQSDLYIREGLVMFFFFSFNI